MPQNKFQAIIFDLDNTLLDFMELKKKSCAAAILAMIDAGLDVDKNTGLELLFSLYDKYGIEDHLILQRFLLSFDKKISYPVLAAGIVAYRNARSSYLNPFPHVNQTLEELQKRGVILAILTDAPRMNAWIRLAAMRLCHYFKEVITYDDTHKQKPSKEPFLQLLKKLKVEPESCLMVGDWFERDIVGAASVGIKTCFAKYGSVKSPSEIKSDYSIEDIKQLLDIV